MKNKLTPKQKMFVKEYLVDLNATQAAIRAGYSKKTANKIGSENLSKPDLQAAIASAMTKRAEKVECTAEYVVGELMRGAGVDGAEMMSKQGITKLVNSLGFYKAMELLGKHLGIFTDKIKHEGLNFPTSVAFTLDNGAKKDLEAGVQSAAKTGGSPKVSKR